MSNYKHGNWYCKPANESEAREIVERAGASGAKKAETLEDYYWNDLGVWGVYSGRTLTQNMDFYRNVVGIEYTIEQVREKFPLPSEHTEQSWNGEGLPPAGTVCSIQLAFSDMGKCEITYMGNGVYCYRQLSTKREYTGSVHDTVFRPIRSERERWVQYCVEEIITPFDKDTKNGAKITGYFTLAEYLYDALKSGDLKAPEVE